MHRTQVTNALVSVLKHTAIDLHASLFIPILKLDLELNVSRVLKEYRPTAQWLYEGNWALTCR